MKRWFTVVVLGSSLLHAAGAEAAVFCADPARPECEPSAAAAFAAAAANPGPDTVLLAALTETEPVGDAPGEPVEVLGAGAVSVLAGGLTLAEPASSARRLAVAGQADVEGGALVRVRVDGDVALGAGARLEDVGATGAIAACGAGAAARHVTAASARTVCDGGTLALSDSALFGPEPIAGAVATRHSAYAASPGHDPAATDLVRDDLGLDGLVPRAGSPLLDAGDPAPLGPDESLEDLAGLPRMADADGDGTARRDVGAYEHHPPPPVLPAGNLLRNPGAEAGLDGWLSSGFASFAYGSGFFPSTAAGAALGGGERFFSGGQVAAGTLRQTVDLRHWAPEIDAGSARVDLRALAGGYRADEDAGSVSVSYAGPAGAPVGRPLALPPVTPAQRGHAITLLPRAANGPIPPLARSAEVRVQATRGSGAGYADVYVDRLSLRVAATPVAPPPPEPPPDGPPLEPFAGAAVLTPAPKMGRRGRIRVRLACATATVGRCSGVLTLVAVLRSGSLGERIGSAGFALQPGRLRRVRIRLTLAARRELRRRRRGRMRATLYSAARDGQGLTVTATTPLRLRRR